MELMPNTKPMWAILIKSGQHAAGMYVSESSNVYDAICAAMQDYKKTRKEPVYSELDIRVTAHQIMGG